MTVALSSGAATRSPVLLSPYAMDRLLRLRTALEQRRTAEQLLHGAALADARRFLPRAIFSLYLDCRDAGVGEEARRLLVDAGLVRAEPAEAAPVARLHRADRAGRLADSDRPFVPALERA